MSQSPRWMWITMIVLQVVQMLSLTPWLLIAGFSIMAFDAPGSEKMWGPRAFVIGIWSYPIWLLAAGGIAWGLFAFKWRRTALGITIAFTLPMPVLAMLLVFAAGR